MQTPSLPRPVTLELGLGLLSGTWAPSSLGDTRKAHAPIQRGRPAGGAQAFPGPALLTLGALWLTLPDPRQAFSCGASPIPADAPGDRLCLQGRRDWSPDSRPCSRRKVAAGPQPRPTGWRVVVFMLC